MWYFIGFLAIWTLFSIWWFISHLGDKMTKKSKLENYRDNVILAPMLVIIYIFVWGEQLFQGVLNTIKRR